MAVPVYPGLNHVCAGVRPQAHCILRTGAQVNFLIPTQVMTSPLAMRRFKPDGGHLLAAPLGFRPGIGLVAPLPVGFNGKFVFAKDIDVRPYPVANKQRQDDNNHCQDDEYKDDV